MVDLNPLPQRVVCILLEMLIIVNNPLVTPTSVCGISLGDVNLTALAP